MNKGEGKFARYKRGASHLAYVILEIDSGVAATTIDFECFGEGFVGQGYVEEVPAVGYDDWKAGAKVGIEFALKTARLTTSRVVVKQISGLTADTNPTSVGAAASIATWNAIGYTPEPEVMERIEGIVFASWSRGFDAIPVFD